MFNVSLTEYCFFKSAPGPILSKSRDIRLLSVVVPAISPGIKVLDPGKRSKMAKQNKNPNSLNYFD